jgi:hypothetical protein
MPPPARRPDPQTDYEDPIDRLYRRTRRPRGGREATAEAAEKVPSTTATVSYYLGMVAVVPVLGLVFGPIALLLGILALGHTSHPKVSGKGRAKSGIWFGLFACLINYGILIAWVALMIVLR